MALIVLALIFIYNFYDLLIDEILIIDKLLIVAIAYCVIDLAFHIIRHTLIALYNKNEAHPHPNMTLGIKSISYFLQYFMFILYLVNTLFINIKDLLTSISIVAVAIVLIFREHIVNFINGIVLMFTTGISIGDVIQIGDHRGKVKTISFQYVELADDTGETVFLPNNTIFTKEFRNYSKERTNTIQLTVRLKRTKNDLKKFKVNLRKLIDSEFKDQTTSSKVITTMVDKDFIETKVLVNVKKYNMTLEDQLKNRIKEIAI